jgi:hypothetical protein
MIVKLKKKESLFRDLTPNQPYFVIGIEADDFRILNDNGKPYLYSSDMFQVIDSREPTDWVTDFGEDGERYAYPRELNESGFFEDYFDGNEEAVSRFWKVVNRRLSDAA